MRIKSIAIAAAILTLACNRGPRDESARRGMVAIGRYGCGSCHTIGGVPGANGLVGPPLKGIRNRVYVAGMLTNTAGNLARWIAGPKSINERTAMPDLGVTPEEAVDISRYLYFQ